MNKILRFETIWFSSIPDSALGIFSSKEWFSILCPCPILCSLWCRLRCSADRGGLSILSMFQYVESNLFHDRNSSNQGICRFDLKFWGMFTYKTTHYLHFVNGTWFYTLGQTLSRPRWSRGNVLALRSKVRGFIPGWGRWIFQDVKILSTSIPGGTLD